MEIVIVKIIVCLYFNLNVNFLNDQLKSLK